MLSPEPKNVINEGLTKKKSQEAQGQHSRGGGGGGGLGAVSCPQTPVILRQIYVLILVGVVF